MPPEAQRPAAAFPIEHRDPADLRRHKLLKDLPSPNRILAQTTDHTPEWSASARAFDARGGPAQPLRITADGRVLDVESDWSLAAARAFQIAQVACIVWPEEEAAALFEENLLDAAKMTRGAAIYLLLPLAEDIFRAALWRRHQNLLKGRRTNEPENPPKPQCFSESELLRFGELKEPTVKALCERWGVDWKTINQAREIRSLFFDPQCKRLAQCFRDERIKTPEELKELQAVQARLRDELEPQLLNGTKNLWTILPYVGGKLAPQNHGKPALSEDEQLELDFFNFTPLKKDLRRWGRLTPAQQETALLKFTNFIDAAPPALMEKLIEIIEDRGKGRARN